MPPFLCAGICFITRDYADRAQEHYGNIARLQAAARKRDAQVVNPEAGEDAAGEEGGYEAPAAAGAGGGEPEAAGRHAAAAVSPPRAAGTAADPDEASGPAPAIESLKEKLASERVKRKRAEEQVAVLEKNLLAARSEVAALEAQLAARGSSGAESGHVNRTMAHKSAGSRKRKRGSGPSGASPGLHASGAPAAAPRRTSRARSRRQL